MNLLTTVATTVLVLAGAPALANWPECYTVEGENGATGTLRLTANGETMIRRRAKYDLDLSVRFAERELRLAGSVKAADDMLEGTLRRSQGLTGHLSRIGRQRPWTIRIGQGMRNVIVLSKGSETIRLTGSANVGARSAENEALIRRFYTAFQEKDAATMASVYAADIHFSDRVFPNLHGAKAGAMWAMLCESDDLTVTFSGVQAGERYGVARWVADYTVFGNKVHNVIDASFEFKDGEIIRHVDHFDFDVWVRQALPGPRRFLGAQILLKNIRLGLKAQLYAFQRKQERAG